MMKERMTQFLYQMLMQQYFKMSFTGAPIIRKTLFLLWMTRMRTKKNKQTASTLGLRIPES
jgi:hypothetical protein